MKNSAISIDLSVRRVGRESCDDPHIEYVSICKQVHRDHQSWHLTPPFDGVTARPFRADFDRLGLHVRFDEPIMQLDLTGQSENGSEVSEHQQSVVNAVLADGRILPLMFDRPVQTDISQPIPMAPIVGLDIIEKRVLADADDAAAIVYMPADPQAGCAAFLDGTTQSFSQIVTAVPCFTKGTVVATPDGARRVEDLKIGDLVQTRDNGIQAVCWSGQKTVSRANLAVTPELRPVRIAAGALGRGQPARDMLVSPNHRVLVMSDAAGWHFAQTEVLVPAIELITRDGIDVVNTDGVTYVHFMFANHEIVLSDGVWSESFQPREQTLDGVGQAQRDEIFALFPELATAEGVQNYGVARRSLKSCEAALVI